MASQGEGLLPKKRREGLEASQLSAPGIDDKIKEIIAGVESRDPAAHQKATAQLKEPLSTDNPPTDEVVRSGVIPDIVRFLNENDYPEHQIDAAWVLARITCGTKEDRREVFMARAVPCFLKLLGSASDDVCEPALTGLANIAGDFRFCVLKSGALTPLLNLLEKKSKLPLLKIATRALCELCRKGPVDEVKPALPALKRLISSKDQDHEILEDACWALYDLSSGVWQGVEAVIDEVFCPALVELLRHSSPSVLFPAHCIVAKISQGNYNRVEVILSDENILRYLGASLRDGKDPRVKEAACVVILNIAAGTKEQARVVIERGLIELLFDLLPSPEVMIRKLVACAISNATFYSTPEEIGSMVMVRKGCIKLLCDLLEDPDPKGVRYGLDGLKNILSAGGHREDVGSSGVYHFKEQWIDAADDVRERLNVIYSKKFKDSRPGLFYYEEVTRGIRDLAFEIHEGDYWGEDGGKSPAGDAYQKGLFCGNEHAVPFTPRRIFLWGPVTSRQGIFCKPEHQHEITKLGRAERLSEGEGRRHHSKELLVNSRREWLRMPLLRLL